MWDALCRDCDSFNFFNKIINHIQIANNVVTNNYDYQLDNSIYFLTSDLSIYDFTSYSKSYSNLFAPSKPGSIFIINFIITFCSIIFCFIILWISCTII